MICEHCDGIGLVPFLPTGVPASNLRDDLHFAVCLCESGRSMRVMTNERRKVAARWRVWCAREQVDPSRVWKIEDLYTAPELAAMGLVVKQGEEFREAALLAAGKRTKG